MKVTRNQALAGIGLVLVGYMLWRRFGPVRAVGAPLAQSQDGTVTEYTVEGCDCYRVDNNPDGTQIKTMVDRGLCRGDYDSPSLAHCGGV